MKRVGVSRKRHMWMVRVVAFAALLSATGGLAWGQSNHEINGAIQFNFTPPGARSLAMGGAFIGRADDATAAYTNPAGLIWLSRPEVAVEGRSTTYETVYFNGRLDGNPTNCVGVGYVREECLDTVSGLSTQGDKETITNLSFLSVALPVGHNYRLAFYRHELANLVATINNNERAFYQSNTQDALQNSSTWRTLGINAGIDLNVIDYGVSTAFRFTENFWGGVGLIYREFKLDSVARNYSQFGPGGALNFGRIDFSDSNSGAPQLQYGDDSGLSFSAGLFFKTPNDRWSGGLAYQQSTKFDYTLKTCSTEACGEGRQFLSGNGTFTIPSVFGVGIAFSPGDSWMFSLQYNQVSYSDLAPDLNSLGELLTTVERGGEFGTGDFIYLDDFKVDDSDEIHFGIEYVILANTPIALRVGAWYDPAHQLYYREANRSSDGLDPEEQAKLDDARKKIQVRFPGGDDQVHYTGGIGAVFADNFQLEFGFDIADLSTIYSLSAVVRF
jgi:long-chain fatty acid transport protein